MIVAAWSSDKGCSMADEQPLEGIERLHPPTERRTGRDRRKGDSQEFFARGGVERRSGFEARKKRDRRPDAPGEN
jgi:hypothetical protein